MTNLRVAAHLDGTLNHSSFTAEIRLPFAEIYRGIPGSHTVNGTQLRLNLNRINWNTPPTLGGRGAARTDTYYARSPVPRAAPPRALPPVG